MFRMYNVVFSVQLALLKRPLRAHIIGNRHCSLVSNSIAHLYLCATYVVCHLLLKCVLGAWDSHLGLDHSALAIF